MTKNELIALLSSTFAPIAPPQGNPELVETVGTCKKYLFHHLDTGKDEDGQPVAHKAFKVFYVLNEGLAQEAAYLEDTAAKSRVDKNCVAAVPAAPSAIEIYNLYSSSRVRDRVKGLMVRAANDIYNEDAGTVNHAQRMKWALAILQSVESSVNVMMAFVSMNPVVLSGSWTDEDLRFIVNSNIDKWAVSIYS